MTDIKNLYNQIMAKSDSKFITYENEAIYLYPKTKLSTSLSLAFMAILLGASSGYFFYDFLKTPESNFWCDSNLLWGILLCILFLGTLGFLFFKFLVLDKRWFVKIDNKGIFHQYGRDRSSVCWADIVDIQFQRTTITTGGSTPTALTHKYIVIHADVNQDELSFMQKMNRSFGFGHVNINGEILPLPIKDMYEMLREYWTNKKNNK
jgi:hypothetical protein